MGGANARIGSTSPDRRQALRRPLHGNRSLQLIGLHVLEGEGDAGSFSGLVETGQFTRATSLRTARRGRGSPPSTRLSSLSSSPGRGEGEVRAVTRYDLGQ